MSRIGKKPVLVPDGVSVSIDGRTITVEGPKGKLSWTHRAEVRVAYSEADRSVSVTRSNDERQTRALHGTTRALIANMVEGCLKGYSKGLELYGVGYGVQVQGDRLMMNVGYATPRGLTIPPGVTVTIQVPQARGDTEPARFSVSGADKHAVGQFAAECRKVRPPEPYKGKGVRYAGEYVRRKVGKAFAGAAT